MKKRKCRDDKKLQIRSNKILILWPLDLICHQNFISQTSKTMHATRMHVHNLEPLQAT
jgi:hypothetical protein